MRSRIAIVVIVAIGVLLRVRALFTEFWLDEIWSLRIAQEVHSWIEIFTRVHHDNNHPLNTLFLYLLGDQPNWIWYRTLSFVCGLALIALLIRAARNESERIAITIFASLSLPMIVYATEARGYAPAAMLCVAAYVYREKQWLSAIAITLAMLAHLTAAFVFVALAASVWVPLPQRHRDRWGSARHNGIAYIMPLGVAAWLTVSFAHVIIGGGPASSKLAISIEAASSILGGSGVLVALLAIIILIFEIAKREDKLFFVLALFVVPAIAIVGAGDYVSARYLFVCIPFALLLLASFVSRNPKAGVAIVIVWILATSLQLMPFLRFGRGTYIEAMRFMAPAVVSGDNDFRNGTMIAFYSRYVKGIRYASDGDWYLIESFGDFSAMPRAIKANGHDFALAKIFPYGGTSGWTWLVYRRVRPLSNPASSQR
jgi:hypothetical protein